MLTNQFVLDTGIYFEQFLYDENIIHCLSFSVLTIIHSCTCNFNYR